MSFGLFAACIDGGCTPSNHYSILCKDVQNTANAGSYPEYGVSKRRTIKENSKHRKQGKVLMLDAKINGIPINILK